MYLVKDIKETVSENNAETCDIFTTPAIALVIFAIFSFAESILRSCHLRNKQSNGLMQRKCDHMYILSYTFPLMLLDVTFLAVLVGLTIYAVSTTEILHKPFNYGGQLTHHPPKLIMNLLALNLGRYLAKMQFSLHNELLRERIILCSLAAINAIFIIICLSTKLFLGLALIGILSESSGILRWIHYIPDKYTQSKAFITLAFVKFVLTYLAKGVQVLSFTVIFCLLQNPIKNVDIIALVCICPVLFILTIVNMRALFRYTIFILDTLGKRHFLSSNLQVYTTTNQNSKIFDKKPILFVNNELNTTKSTAAIKEKNCNLQDNLTPIKPKINKHVFYKSKGVNKMDVIKEETASQASDLAV